MPYINGTTATTAWTTAATAWHTTTTPNTYAADYATNNIANVLGTSLPNIHMSYVEKSELDRIIGNIYRVITEHIKLDITEEDFIELVKE